MTLLEIILSFTLLGIASTGVAYSLMTSLRVEKITEVHLAASSLCAAKIEELSAVDIENLDTSFNETNATVTLPSLNIPFERTTTVTVNADQSRTIRVTVRSTKSNVPATADFETRFALWE